MEHPSVYLISPKVPDSHNGFTGMEKYIHKPWSYMPLALPVLASVTPSQFPVTCCDENVENIDFDHPGSIIGITCNYTQAVRAFEIAKVFKEKGKTVVMGGPFPTYAQKECLEYCDVVFEGEAEDTWPAFLGHFTGRTFRKVYSPENKVDLEKVPPPRYDTLKLERYFIHCVQSSRGCPHHCEFCDIPTVLGHKMRLKKPEQIVKEVEILEKAGARQIYMVDDNFIGKKKHAYDTLRALIDYRKTHHSKLSFSTQMTILAASDESLLQLLYDANFNSILIGVESPRLSSLKETQKIQNTLRPLMADLKKIQSYNITIVAAMIQGFDNDTPDIFREQFEFLMEANIPMPSLTVLQALPGTPLLERMKKEGRLYPDGDKHYGVESPSFLTNFEPGGLTQEQLVAGHQWLWRMLFKSDHYAERIIRSSQIQGVDRQENAISVREKMETLVLFLITLFRFLGLKNRNIKKMFRKILLDVNRTKFSFGRLRKSLLSLWYFLYMREVFERIYKFKDPELVDEGLF